MLPQALMLAPTWTTCPVGLIGAAAELAESDGDIIPLELESVAVNDMSGEDMSVADIPDEDISVEPMLDSEESVIAAELDEVSEDEVSDDEVVSEDGEVVAVGVELLQAVRVSARAPAVSAGNSRERRRT